MKELLERGLGLQPLTMLRGLIAEGEGDRYGDFFPLELYAPPGFFRRLLLPPVPYPLSFLDDVEAFPRLFALDSCGTDAR